MVPTLLYLLPPLTGAVALSAVRRAHPVFALAVLPGTLAHELLHYIAGKLSWAAPSGIDIWPRRQPNGSYRLGAATFMHVRWWNAAFVALAPLAGYPLAYEIAAMRVQSRWDFSWSDAVWWILLAQLMYSSWPSPSDWRQAMRSWPLLVAGLSCALLCLKWPAALYWLDNI